MTVESENAMRTILAGHGIHCPSILVETGTYLGHGITEALGNFDEIHSIELVERYAKEAVQKFRAHPEVTIHWGDSTEKLKELSAQLNEPVLFYLDAHYSGGSTAYGKPEHKGCPILSELAVLGRRAEKDVVIIDDIRLMGRATWSGIQDDPVYPRTYFDFTHITLTRILKSYARSCRRIRQPPNPDGGCDWMILSPN
jgi:hypothetical protein